VVHRLAPEEGPDTDARLLLSLTSTEAGDGAGTEDEGSTTERFEGVDGRSTTAVDGIKPPDEVPALDFPAPDRKPDSWTRPPTARLLPDQWLVYGVWDGDGERGPTSFLTTTDAVRESLPIGPTPEELTLAHPDRGGDDDRSAAADEALAWLTDFGEAEKAGMAFRVTGSTVFGDSDGDSLPDLTDGRFDVLVVAGVKSSMDHQRSARELERLFEAHHYTDGLEFLEVDTPTNNYDRKSGYSSADNPTESMAVETRATSLVAHGDNSDGDRLARALAIDPDPGDPHVFGRVENADKTEWLDGWHARSALWPATAGYYLSNMLVSNEFAGTESLWDGGDSGLNQEMPTVAALRERMEWFESYRSHFIHHVSPYGPLSSFRVDTQPYGVLPVTPMADDRADVYDVTPESSAWFPGDGGGFGDLFGGNLDPENLIGDDWASGDSQDLITAIANAAVGASEDGSTDVEDDVSFNFGADLTGDWSVDALFDVEGDSTVDWNFDASFDVESDSTVGGDGDRADADDPTADEGGDDDEQ
jgi:hypothetical protein